ncbi:MAG: cell division protein SepF [Clostridia bacterium]|jgi:cell division inhibitor SepF|nr:cell division protein SepF [Clostridia bacterium]
MGVVDKFLDIMGFTEVREEVITEQENIVETLPEIKTRNKPKGQIVPFNAGKEQIRVVLVEPVVFDDCQQISDSLKSRRTVIINLENMDMVTARRIIDFVGGTAYALGGTLQKIGAGIIIAVPNNVDISGDLASMSQPKDILSWINKVNQGTELRGR